MIDTLDGRGHCRIRCDNRSCMRVWPARHESGSDLNEEQTIEAVGRIEGWLILEKDIVMAPENFHIGPLCAMGKHFFQHCRVLILKHTLWDGK